MRGTPSKDLTRTLADVARDLQAESGEEATLAAIVRAAVATVPGAAYGGITQVQGRRLTAKVPTDAIVGVCDELQSELGEGPCLDAIWHQHTVIVADMAHEDRWPTFAARAAELGVGSLISFQLYVHDDTLGALNLYGGRGVRFGDEERTIGELFASHSAVALAGARSSRQLTEALASRDLIGQAKGILMQRHGVNGQHAFNMLVRASQEANVKLVEVARWLVDEHENPGRARPPARSRER